MIGRSASFDSARVARHYDELDEFYREIWGEHVHHGLWLTGDESPEQAVRQLVALVAGRAHIGAGSRVCDAGSGYGAAARMLARRGASVTAVTLSPAQHAYARRAAKSERVEYVLGDFLSYPLPSAHFDAVVAIESMEHMQDQGHFLQRAADLLRPGGRLVICAWLAREGLSPWQERCLLEPICREGQLSALRTPAEFVRMVDESAFQLDGFEDLTVRVRRTWRICAVRVIRRLATDARYRRFLLDRARSERAFALTLLRVLSAYYTGVMGYGIFTLQKPSVAGCPTHRTAPRHPARQWQVIR